MKDIVRLAMHQALEEAEFSPDPSTQNGAVIISGFADVIIASGCNEFPEGVQYTDERWERPLKYRYIEHAERNAIFDMARNGHVAERATMVAVWASCSDCARAIVQSGIRTLVRFPNELMAESANQHWLEDIEIGDTIMCEAGVEVIEFDPSDLQGSDVVLRRNGKAWSPDGSCSCACGAHRSCQCS